MNKAGRRAAFAVRAAFAGCVRGGVAGRLGANRFFAVVMRQTPINPPPTLRR